MQVRVLSWVPRIKMRLNTFERYNNLLTKLREYTSEAFWLRTGEVELSLLEEVNPKMAEEIRNSPFDPRFCQKEKFLEHLKKTWR